MGEEIKTQRREDQDNYTENQRTKEKSRSVIVFNVNERHSSTFLHSFGSSYFIFGKNNIVISLDVFEITLECLNISLHFPCKYTLPLLC